MAEKNSLWKNIRKKAEQNRRTGATPKKPTKEMLKQERKIKAKQYQDGGKLGNKYVAERDASSTRFTPAMSTSGKESNYINTPDSLAEDVFEFFDPTGISSWNDALAEDADVLDKFSVVPIFGKASKFLKTIKSPKTGLNAYHAVKALGTKDLLERFNQKANGGTIIDPRGQWAHPGKRTIVPSPTGQITMQGVPYPVYGEDETGYGQIMYPNNEYQFPGQMIDETPIKMQGGGDVDDDNLPLSSREVKRGLINLGEGLNYAFENIVSPFVPTGELARQYYFYNYSPVEYPNPINAIKPLVKTGMNLITKRPMETRKIGLDKEGDYNVAEESWRKALDLPIKGKYIIESKYKPTISTEDSKYYTLHPDIIDKQKIIDYVKSEEFTKKSKPGKALNTRVANLESFTPFTKEDFMEEDEFMNIDPLQKFQIYKGYDPEKKQWYAAIYDKYDFDFEPANKVIKPYEFYDRAYYLSDEKPAKEQPVNFKIPYKSPKELSRIKEVSRDATNVNLRNLPINKKAQGGQINPYMYYAGGPIEYGKGGNFLKHVGTGAYAIAEGALDTITMGATDQLTDKGFEWLTKVGNKNMDLSDPKNAKFLKTQQQIKGYGNTAAAITTGIVTGNVKGAVSQSAKGLNTAFQASDWASDDFKKWSQGISSGVQFASGFMGGNPTSAVGSATSGANAASTASQASNVASSIGKGSNIANKASNFGQKATDASKYINQVSGMIGGNEQPLWQQAEARQDYLNSPEYLAMKDEQNQEYLNRNFNNFITPTSPNLNFAATGGDINNLVTLQNPYSMKDRYKTYKTKYSKGGNIQDKLEANGIVKIPSYVGYHFEHPDGGQAMGPNASVERDELVQLSGGGHAGMGTPEYVYPADVNNIANTNPEEGIYMPKMTSDYKMITDKYGMPRFTKKSPAKWLEEKLNRGSEFRIEVDGPKKESNDQAMAIAKGGREVSVSVNDLKQQAAQEDAIRIAMADNVAAYGGYLSKYKNFNMPYSSGGKLPKEVLRARVESHMSPEEADAYVENYAKGGSIHIKKSKRGTFTAAAKKRGKSVQEFARQVLANKGNYSAAMVKKANFARNAAKWKHANGGPIDPPIASRSNVQQGSRNILTNNLANTEFGSRIINEYDNGLPNDTSYSYMTPTENFFYNTGQNMPDGKPIMNYQGSNPNPNINDYLPKIKGLSRYAAGGPMVSNVQQPFEVAAQNRGGMLMDYANGGYVYQPMVQPMLAEGGNMYYQGGGWTYGDYAPKSVLGPVDINYNPDNYEDLSSPLYNDMSEMTTQYAIDNKPKQSNEIPDGTFQGVNMSGQDVSVRPEFREIYNKGLWKPEGEQTSPYLINQPNQPNQGLTGLDYASMGMQALGPLSQLYYGLQGGDDVNYQRVGVEKIDPTVAIVLANEEARRAQDLAGYNLRQNAPTSGSYMANMGALGLRASKQRAAQTAATRFEADKVNTDLVNRANALNAQIAMQEQIDRLQEKDAARTNITEGLSGVGSTTANVIRDYRTNQINQMIANNIGTNDYKFDPITNTITYRNQQGKLVTLPIETVVPPNIQANVGTGQIQKKGQSQFNLNFDRDLMKQFRKSFNQTSNKP